MAFQFTFMLPAQTYLFSETNLSTTSMTSSQSERYTKLSSENFSSSQFVQIGNLSTVQQNGTVTVPLPSGSGYGNVTFRVKNIEYYSDADFTWYGQVDEATTQSARAGEIFLLRKNGEYMGTIQVEDDLYSLTDLTGGVALLGKTSIIPISGSCPVAPDTLEYPLVTSSAVCDVRILVLYTSEAQDLVGNIQNVAEADINYTNQAFANSALTTKIVKVGIEAWPGYSETDKTYETILDELRINGNSPAGFVNSRKIALGADIVVLLVRHSLTAQDALGIAYLAPSSWTQGYAVSWTTAVSPVVFAHEVGHLFGADHEPCSAIDATTNCSINENSPFHAHSLNITLPAQWPIPPKTLNRKTIVWGNFIQGKHITGFSNPDVSILGTPTGTTTRNNALRIKNRTCLLSGLNPNEGTLNGYIAAPTYGCEGEEETAVGIVTSPPAAMVTYEWRISTNGGISYGAVVGTSDVLTFIMPPAPGSLVLKLVITGSTGQSITLFKTITSKPSNNPFYCRQRGASHQKAVAKLDISVSPNPAAEIVHFVIASPSERAFSLEIFDAKGGSVRQQEGKLLSGDNSLQVNLNSCPKGIYYFTVSSEGEFVTNNFILN